MAKKKPIKLVTLDTETYNGLVGGLKRIAIYDGNEVIYGYKFEDIEPYLIQWSKAYNVHVYIHNLEFDLRKLTYLFEKKKIDWGKSFIINGKMATVHCKKYVLHDSFKILPMSLKKLSKDFDVEHGKLDLWEEVQKRYRGKYEDIVDFLDACDVDDPLYIEYLGYDVISLYEILQKVIDLSGLELDVFVKRISTASLSRYLFQHGWKGYLFKDELFTKTDFEILCSYDYYKHRDIEDFLRQSYCGGRTEVFKPHLKKEGFHYDVNSLYPSVMLGDFPVGKPEYYKTTEAAEEYFKDWQRNRQGIGFIHAMVYVPKQHIPPLPVKMGKLVFPCGEIYGVWTFEELDYAINECGVEVKEFYSVCYFRNTYPVFKRFVEKFYTLKEEATIEGNESLRTFSKLIMNVGYGYTGMSRDDKTQLKDISELDKYRSEVVAINEDMGFIEIPSDIKAGYIQVAVASTVTSRARLVLLKALRDADSRGNVYYCDTDSIVTDEPINSEIVHPTKLGFWDLEAEPLRAIFLRPKVYAEVVKKDDKEKENVKFKGVSKDTQKDLDYSFYEKLYHELMDDTKDSILIEKNKLVMRSIMYMEKNDIPLDYVEYRDKKMNLQTVEKRNMNYEENFTEPLFFETYEKFRDFEFKKPKNIVPF